MIVSAFASSASPSQGSPSSSVSARHFVLGDSELVALPRLDHEFAPVPFPDGARNRKPEMTVLQPVKYHLLKTGESLPDLWTARAVGVIVCRFVTHCAAAPSCPLWSKKMRGAARRLRRRNTPSRLCAGLGDRGTQRPCAALRRVGRSDRSPCNAGSRRDRNRASRTRSRPTLPSYSPVQLTLDVILKKKRLIPSLDDHDR